MEPCYILLNCENDIRLNGSHLEPLLFHSTSRHCHVLAPIAQSPCWDLLSEISLWKLAIQKTRCCAPQEMCPFDRASKTSAHHSGVFADGQEKIIHPGISQPVTHFKQIQSESDGGHVSKGAGQKSDIHHDTATQKGFLCFFVAFTNRDVYMSLCISDGRRPNTNDGLSELPAAGRLMTEQCILCPATLFQHQLN